MRWRRSLGWRKSEKGGMRDAEMRKNARSCDKYFFQDYLLNGTVCFFVLRIYVSQT